MTARIRRGIISQGPREDQGGRARIVAVRVVLSVFGLYAEGFLGLEWYLVVFDRFHVSVCVTIILGFGRRRRLFVLG